MPPLQSILQGQFSTPSLRLYLALETFFFYGCIFLCWRQFPVEHDFSILTHTFSYLGSFNEDRNPEGWWLFCVAMTAWGLASIPVVRYIYHRLAPIAPQGGRVAALLLMQGCVGIIIVGLFPDARDTLVGWIRWTTVHYVGAATLVLGFIIGIPLTAHIIRRAAHLQTLDESTRSAFRRARWPQALFLTTSTIALYFLTRWLFVYEDLKAYAQANGLEIGSSWREAMNSPYSFPLWDNVFVHTLFLYFVWTALTLPNHIPRIADTHKS